MFRVQHEENNIYNGNVPIIQCNTHVIMVKVFLINITLFMMATILAIMRCRASRGLRLEQQKFSHLTIPTQ